MTSQRRRIEELQERVWQHMMAKLERYLEGRSVPDVKFFCVHGYLPETPMPGPPCRPLQSKGKERWSTWKEHKRRFEGRTKEEMEFFCAHGHFPERSKAGSHGKP